MLARAPYAAAVIRPFRRAALLCAAAALTLGACESAPKPTPIRQKSLPTSSADPGTTTPEAGAAGPGSDVTVAFAGDIHFTGRTAKLLRDPATAIGPTSKIFSAADLAMVNLESAVTEGGTPEPKEYHFRAPATAFAALQAAGIDVASMANNHAMDYGRAGLADTLKAIRSTKYPVVGVGATAKQAFAAWVADVRGTQVAFIGLSQIRERAPQWSATAGRGGVASALDTKAAVAAVKAARGVADAVVVYLHWGKEGYACPTPAMKDLAKALAQAGADAIISTHAHVMLGGGYLGRTYVQYGLGNFVWWLDNAHSNDTGVLTITLRGRQVVKAELTPARISSTGQPVVATGPQAKRIAASYAKLRGCTGLAAAPKG